MLSASRNLPSEETGLPVICLPMDKENGIGGHGLLALERFHDDTRHMMICEVYAPSAYGNPGDKNRWFLTEQGYADALTAAQKRQIKIKSHAAIVEGHILPDKKKKRRGH